MGNETSYQSNDDADEDDEFANIYPNSYSSNNNNDEDNSMPIITPAIPHFESLLDHISSEIDSDYDDDDNEHEFISNISPQSMMPSFAQQIDGAITDHYTVEKQLGRGVSGNVMLVSNKNTKQQFALKQMVKTELNKMSFLRETTILKAMHHPNIVSFDGAYISSEYYGITTSYCAGGTLLGRIVQMKRFSEQDASEFIKTLLEALDYLHSKGIVHRDLKLNNIMFDGDCLKLIDFGESEFIHDPNQIDNELIGTLHYLPPECTRARKKFELFAGDLWAVGVICYILINGVKPFFGRSKGEIIGDIQTSPVRWKSDVKISNCCKHFIESLLCKATSKRLDTKKALSHPWITGKASTSHLGDEYLLRLQRFNFRTKLQKTMVKSILNGMDDESKKDLLSSIETSGQRQSAFEKSLVDNVLTYAKNNLPHENSKSESGHFVQFSDKNLVDLDMDEMLNEIDADTTSKQEKAMTVDQFIQIMTASEKQYDIPAILRHVSPNDEEVVTFEKIASFHGPMQSL